MIQCDLTKYFQFSTQQTPNEIIVMIGSNSRKKRALYKCLLQYEYLNKVKVSLS